MCRRAAVAVAVVAACIGPVARSEDGPAGTSVDPGQIAKAIESLRELYRASLDKGKQDEELKNLLRELNAAVSASDWARAAELLARRETKDSGGPIPQKDVDLWPLRTGQAAETPSEPYTFEKTSFESVGGLRLGALLYKPREAQGKSPLIVLGHGGFRGIPLEYRRLAEALAKVGYVVYVPEFRGQGQSEGNIEYAAGEVLDFLSALEVAKKLDGVDANRVGLVGGGHGGTVVLLALARAEGIACAATISAPTDLVALVREVPAFERELKLLKASVSPGDINALRQRSPIYYAAGVQVPVLILHGEKDRMVPAKSAEGYAAVLRNRGKEVQYIKYALAGEDLPAKLGLYHMDLQNFLAERLKPPGWKIKKGSPPPPVSSPTPSEGQSPGETGRRRRRD